MPDFVPIPSPGIPLAYGAPEDPLVVVIHDWYGRLPWLEPFAMALAAHGFRVVVPDLFDGLCTTESAGGRILLERLDLGFALAAIDDIIQEARADGSKHVGVIGFSMGGWISLLHAQGGESDAVVAYYASLTPEDHGVIPCPVLLQFAETDEWSPGEQPAEFIARLEEHGTPVTAHTYLGTRHSFANASLPLTRDANASALAFARTTSFLMTHLFEPEVGY